MVNDYQVFKPPLYPFSSRIESVHSGDSSAKTSLRYVPQGSIPKNEDIQDLSASGSATLLAERIAKLGEEEVEVGEIQISDYVEQVEQVLSTRISEYASLTNRVQEIEQSGLKGVVEESNRIAGIIFKLDNTNTNVRQAIGHKGVTELLSTLSSTQVGDIAGKAIAEQQTRSTSLMESLYPQIIQKTMGMGTMFSDVSDVIDFGGLASEDPNNLSAASSSKVKLTWR